MSTFDYNKPRVKQFPDGSHELQCGDVVLASWAPGALDPARVNSMLAEAFDEGRRAKAREIRRALECLGR